MKEIKSKWNSWRESDMCFIYRTINYVTNDIEKIYWFLFRVVLKFIENKMKQRNHMILERVKGTVLVG